MAFKLTIEGNALLGYGVFPEFIVGKANEEINSTPKEKDNPLSVFEDDNYYERESISRGFNTVLTAHTNNNECVEKELLNNKNIIKNISFDQSEILWNIMQLYNNGNPFDCDMTASELKFYEGRGRGAKYDIPIPKILFDVFPQDERIQKITQFEKLPLEDGSIHSIICDLPFVISPKKCPSIVNQKEGSNLISKRFSSFYPAEELFENIYWWINECYRVLDEGGFLVWKMQSTISGGRQVWASPFSFLCATKAGFYPADEFILEAKARLIASSKIQKQQHSRKYTSNFFVFIKGDKREKKNNILNILKACEQNVHEGKKWEIK